MPDSKAANEKTALVSLRDFEEPLSKKYVATEFGKLAAPFVLSRFIGAASEMGGAFMLSRLGSDELEASNLITVYGNFIITSLVVSLYSTGILQKRAIADHQKAEVGALLQRSYVYAMTTGLVGSVVLAFSADILMLFGQAETPARLAGDSMRAFAITGGLIGSLASVSSQQTAYAIGKPNLVLAVNIARRAIYMGLAYAMIFGEWGSPALGAAGLGYARSISSSLDQVFFTFYYALNKDPKLAQYRLFKVGLTETLKDLKAFFLKSLSVGAQTFNELLSNFVGAILIGLRGTEGLAASEVAIQYATLFNIANITAAQAVALLVGRYKNNLRHARLVGNVSMGISMSIPIIAIPLLIAAREPLAALFIDQNGKNAGDIQEMAETLMLYVAFQVMFDTVRNLSAGALKGLDYFAIPLLTSIVSMTVLGLGIGAALDYGSDLGAQAIYIGNIIGSLAGAIYLARHWLKTTKIIEGNIEEIEKAPSDHIENGQYGATATVSNSNNRYAFLPSPAAAASGNSINADLGEAFDLKQKSRSLSLRRGSDE